MSYAHILFEQDGPVATIVLNRPEKRNALSIELMDEFEDASTRAGRDDGVSVIVVRANGPAFSAGLDVGSTAERARDLDPAESQWFIQGLLDRWLRFRDLPKPTITSVHGACLGLATQLVVCSDITVVARDAQIGVPKFPNDWIADWWVWRVGAARAKQMNFLVGSAIDGDTAEAWGFANFAVPSEQLEAETYRLARWIAKTPLPMLRLKKMAINQVMDTQGFRAATSHSAEVTTLIARSDAAREVSAYREEHGLQATIERYGPE